jgi:hypothetical protein
LQSRSVLSSTVANNLEAWVLRREEIHSILVTDGNLPAFRSTIPAIRKRSGGTSRRFRHDLSCGTFTRPLCYLPAFGNRGWQMSDTFIIEVASQAAGIVVRDPDGYRFFAATHRFNPLEGQLFRNAREAERAARRLMTGGVTLAA